MKKIILASASPRRKQLLEEANVPFEIMISATDETYPSHLSPEEIAVHIAFSKANAVKEKEMANNKDYTILAADTIVVIDGDIAGKPAGRDEAIKMLASLSGGSHEVITGVCILSFNKKITFFEKTKVHFYDLSAAQIAYYVDHYQPYDKAGAYAIQEWIGMIGVRSIEGDFYNVMGLPISRVIKELESLKSK